MQVPSLPAKSCDTGGHHGARRQESAGIVCRRRPACDCAADTEHKVEVADLMEGEAPFDVVDRIRSGNRGQPTAQRGIQWSERSEAIADIDHLRGWQPQQDESVVPQQHYGIALPQIELAE